MVELLHLFAENRLARSRAISRATFLFSAASIIRPFVPCPPPRESRLGRHFQDISLQFAPAMLSGFAISSLLNQHMRNALLSASLYVSYSVSSLR